MYLSLNGVSYYSTGVLFAWLAPPTISVITPSLGPESGSTRIYIEGENLGPITSGSGGQLMCEFGSSKYRTVSRWESENVISCLTPSHPPADVDVRLVLNSLVLNDEASEDSMFSFTMMHTISKLVPATGPMFGGTTVVVYGTGFMDSNILTCKFGATLVQAEYVSSSIVHCVSPAYSSESMESSAVLVQVSNNGIDFTTDKNSFVYYESMTLGTVSPLFGPVDSSDTVVKFQLMGVTSESSLPLLQCSFGLVEDVLVPVVTSFDTTGAVTGSCVVPKGNAMMKYITVKVSSDTNSSLDPRENEGFVGMFKYTYYGTPVLNSVFPRSGSEVGGSHIWMYGSGFVSTNAVSCKVGDSFTSGTYIS